LCVDISRTARVKAGLVNVTVAARSLSELVNGSFVAVVLPSTSSTLYVDDSVSIVYAVGRHIDAFTYELKVGADLPIPLSEFAGRSSDWPAAIPGHAVGGARLHRFTHAGQYTVVFAVSGRTTVSGPEESSEVETVVTVAATPTLQVKRCNRCYQRCI